MTEYLLYGLQKGETERYTEELLAVRDSLEATQAIIKIAMRDGWHSFRTDTYNGEAPDFTRVVNS